MRRILVTGGTVFVSRFVANYFAQKGEDANCCAKRELHEETGIDVKTVSSMLGHSSAGFTLATYTHATNKVQEQAAAKMGNLLKQAL